MTEPEVMPDVYSRPRKQRIIRIPYSPRPLQRILHDEFRKFRFSLLVCHRRFGKTTWEMNELIRGAMNAQAQRQDLEERRGIKLDGAPFFAYFAPTLKQGKAIAWEALKHYTRPLPDRVMNEQELRITFKNKATIRIFGADNPDSARGIGLDGCAMDEFGQMPKRMYTEVVRPMLAEREGWLIVTGTPQGRNAFYELFKATEDDPKWMNRLFKAGQTGILSEEELASMRETMSPEHYAQEMECSWSSGIPGAYYAKLIDELEQMKPSRIADVPYDPALPVDTWWDIGRRDATSIWFSQSAGNAVRFIDHYEKSGQGLADHVKVVREKPYIYGRHLAPHDMSVIEYGSNQSRIEIASGLGIHFEVAAKLRLEDGIDACRRLLKRSWFDKENTKGGVESLRNYRCEIDDRTGDYRAKPVHDWSSHAADAFRTGAVSVLEAPDSRWKPMKLDTAWVV